MVIIPADERVIISVITQASGEVIIAAERLPASLGAPIETRLYMGYYLGLPLRFGRRGNVLSASTPPPPSAPVGRGGEREAG